MTDLTPGHHPDLPAEEYFAIEAASSSGLKEILISQAHYAERRRRPDSSTPDMEIGTAVHMLLLEGGAAFEQAYAIGPTHEEGRRRFRKANGDESDNWTMTGAYKDWKAEQETAGRTLLDRPTAEQIHAMATAVREHPAASKLLDRAERREHTIIWHDEEFDVPCKMRADAIGSLAGAPVGLDLKTTYRGNAAPDDFARHVARYSYHVQAHHYSAGWRAVEPTELAAWILIVVEKEPPYGVSTMLLNSSWTYAAEDTYRRAMSRYADFYHHGCPDNAPAYPDTIIELEAPSWL